MRKSLLNTAVASSLALFSLQAVAVPYGSVDPRSFSMGGTGVASGTSANAGFVNPALLAAADAEEDFALELPILYARAVDPDNLADEIDRYQSDNLEQNLTNSIDAFLADFTNAEKAAQVAVDADALVSQLLKMSDKALQGEFVGGLVIGIPSKRIGASLTIGSRVVGGGLLNVTEADQQKINELIADAVAGPAALLTNQYVLAQQDSDPSNDLINTLTSNLQTRGAMLTEVGISLAREFAVGGETVALGVTPKYVQVTTFDYRFDVNTATFDIDQGTKEYSNFNIDIGLAKDFGNGWKTGFAVKNLISQQYTTVLGHEINIEPQARAGVSHSTEWVTVALDADLNAADAVAYEARTQYLGLGAELDIFETVQIRIGYRHNMQDSDTSVPTVGLGFSPFGVHIDLAAAANDNEIALSGQLGFRF